MPAQQVFGFSGRQVQKTFQFHHSADKAGFASWLWSVLLAVRALVIIGDLVTATTAAIKHVNNKEPPKYVTKDQASY